MDAGSKKWFRLVTVDPHGRKKFEKVMGEERLLQAIAFIRSWGYEVTELTELDDLGLDPLKK